MLTASKKSDRRGRRLAFETLEVRQLLSITTQMLGDLNPGAAASDPSQFRALSTNGLVFFQATSAANGAELWKTDGTPGGTQMVKDIRPGPDSSSPGYFAEYNGRMYFAADNGTNGMELWTTNGTSDGTFLVKDIYSGAVGSELRDFVVSGSKLFFAAKTAANGAELWVTNGTGAGTVMVQDIAAGSLSSDPAWMVNMNGMVYFQANNQANGEELWKSDGTPGGTVMVKDIFSGPNGGKPEELTPIGSTLFFRADDGISGQEIWKSDGSTAGTSLLKDINAGSLGSSPVELTEFNGALYFAAFDGVPDSGQYGNELWKSDGTPGGTVIVKDINEGEESSFPAFITNANGTLYFQAETLANGVELWKSDGTEAGTVMVKDIYPGTGLSWPSYITYLNGYVFFAATDPAGGDEPWRSLGTDASTARHLDIRGGAASSTPRGFAAANGKIYFSADATSTGTEPWVISAVNEAPTDLFLTPAAIAENQPVGSSAGTLTASDPDAAGDPSAELLTYTLVVGAGSSGNSLFTIQGDQVKTNATFNYEAQTWYSIRVRVTDHGGLWQEKEFPINVTNVDEPPGTVTLTPNNFPESAAIGTTVGNLSAPDPEGANVTYQIVPGDDIDHRDYWMFQPIVGNQLKTAAIFNYEDRAEYRIEVRATDPAANGTSTIVVINLTNVNEWPSDIAVTPSAVDENKPSGSVVGNLSTTDPDVGNNFNYTLVSYGGSSYDNAWFEISGDKLKTTGVFDHEARSSYTIRLRSTDQGGAWFEKVFTIAVNNVNENPLDISLSGNSVVENRAAGTALGTLGTTDPDAGTAFTYSLVAGAGSGDNGYFAIAGDQLVTARPLNYEERASYTVRIRSTDPGNLWTEKQFSLACLDENDWPNDIFLSSNTTPEMQPKGTLIGYFSSADQDVGQAHAYTLVTGPGGATYDNWLFAPSGNELRNAELLDYEARSTYTIRVRSTDAAGGWYEKVMNVFLTNMPDGPSTIGLFEPAASGFSLRTTNTSGPADYTFGYGQPNAGWEVLVGDWNGDGGAGVGLFSPQESTFYLTNAYMSGFAEYTFGYGEPGAGWIPLVGDWDGNGSSGVGLYDPHTSTFYLTNSLAAGFAEYTFGYGEPGAGWIPIVGDWDGNGSTGVGLYDPHTSTFFLTNSLSVGFAEHTFGYGAPNAGWQPMVGDWNGDHSAGVGLYDPHGSWFYLTNAFVSGFAQYTFGYGQPEGGWKPLVGDWDGNATAGVGLYDPADTTFYLINTLQTGTAEYTAVFGQSGHTYEPIVGYWSPTGKAAVRSADSPQPTAQAVDQLDLAALAAAELARQTELNTSLTDLSQPRIKETDLVLLGGL